MNANVAEQIKQAGDKLHDHVRLEQLQHPSLKCVLCSQRKENRFSRGVVLGFLGALLIFRFIKHS